MFGTLGGPELFLIFVVALIVFGPRKLPEIGKSLGRMMSEFRRASNDFRSTIESEVEAEKIRESMRIEPPKASPAPSAAAGEGAATPASEETTPSAPAEDTAAATEEAAAPPTEADAGAAPAPSGPEPVPETVSRQPAPTDPK
jgi:Tat protein translocase TatB subunit